MVSRAWKLLSHDDREVFEDLARRDKARYEVEKTMYAGPWKVPAKKRSQKDPNAPKRPMSAFLSFSNTKRTQVKAENPDLGNAEISRILAQMWKDGSEEERKEHIDKEFELRREYKTAIAAWRKESECEMVAARKEREDEAMKTAMMNQEQSGGDQTTSNYDTNNCTSYPYLHHNGMSPVIYGHQQHQTAMSMHPPYGAPGNVPQQHGHPGAPQPYYPSGAPPQQADASGVSDPRHGEPPYSMDPGHYPPSSAAYYYHGHAQYYGGQQSYAPHQYPQLPPGAPDEADKSHAGKFSSVGLTSVMGAFTMYY
jgi:hypothetical protein